MAAEVIAQGGAGVTVYDAMPSAGRKFLMAGRGGLNLTHSEALPAFLARYGDGRAAISRRRSQRFRRTLCAPGARRWGSRPSSAPAAGCFPKAFKASPLLRGLAAPARCRRRAIRAAPPLDRLGRRWQAVVSDARWAALVEARATVLALGGASWPRLGSDGAWVEMLAGKGVDDGAAAAGQLRLHRRLVGDLSRSLRGPAAEGRGAVVRLAHRARRSDDHAQRHRGRRGLCAVGRAARGDRSSSGQATLHIALRPDLDATRTGRAAVGAARQAIASRTGCARRRICRPSRIGLLQEAAIASGVSLSSLSPAEPGRV